ncbi:hypothetical protein H6F86_10570 [Phormidium sp. FACHB-592]|uniref:Uncharacterized protein n=1 Tax=Stenomitos frigidus AS-A4 TaxID=2933935 RepID=A0ABV0KRF8_9CYAN|nr:hypothetical protein [Phormidium sp. FACHB-592]MBD2074321.1 hypothetical protein [Phormidium sp. FACHB-592]
MQTALEEWRREPVELKCPACGSKKIGTRPTLTGKYPRFCPICKHYFDQPDNFVCDCAAPGSQSKCHDCPNFRKLLIAVKTKAETLQSHSLEELQNQVDLDS